MQLFHTFVVASVVFASSVVANPTVASGGASNTPGAVLCRNWVPLDRTVDELCVPFLSQGFKSSKECLENSGKGYHCVDMQQNGICVDLDKTTVAYFGGECFFPPPDE